MLPHPLLIAPMGAHMFVHPEGEVMGSCRSLKVSCPFMNLPLKCALWKDIAKANKGAKWFQLYFNADTGVTKSLLERAKSCGLFLP